MRVVEFCPTSTLEIECLNGSIMLSSSEDPIRFLVEILKDGPDDRDPISEQAYVYLEQVQMEELIKKASYLLEEVQK